MKHSLESYTFIYCLPKTAHPQKASHSKKDTCSYYKWDYIIFYYLLSCPADIAFRAYIHTFFTGDAFTVTEFIISGLDAHRTIFSAGGASFKAWVLIAAYRWKRHYREHSKHSSHRTKKLTEKTLLQRHADNNKYKKNDTYELFSVRQLKCCKLRKNIPGVVTLQASIDTGSRKNNYQKQKYVFYLLQKRHCFIGKWYLFFALEYLFLYQPRKSIYSVSECAEGADISAEKSAEQDCKSCKSCQCHYKAVHTQHFALAYERDKVFYTFKKKFLKKCKKNDSPSL